MIDTSYTNNIEDVSSLTYSANFFWKRNISIGLLTSVYDFDLDDKNSAVGMGLGLNATYYKPILDDDLNLYIGIDVGAIVATKEVPNHGTHFNFTESVKIGARYNASDRVFVDFGLRYTHISNAGIFGKDRNPGTDFVSSAIGAGIRF